MNRLKKITSVLLLCLMSQFVAFAQEKPKEQSGKAETTAAPTRSSTPPPFEFGLLEDTPVRIKLARNISSKDAKVGDKVDFQVIEDVTVKDVVVIRQGGMAMATVTKAKPKGRLGRSGKLDINIDYVQLITDEKVPLRAVKGGSGGTRTTAMTSAMVAAGILFFPAAPLFLFMKGKNIEIPKGTEVTAYVSADTPLDRAKFSEAVTEAAPSIPAATTSPVTITSIPVSADITIDDKFVGTAPSVVQLTVGEHRIVVTKFGYKAWERTLTVNSGGGVNLNVELEKLP
ncbi:MAG TPA: PEGA domain-containing protein [Pyrinomonadaceae bacterium]|nr:PEGA domain-containing protein [Pyrinomonadaceae bacterium]